MRGVIVLLLYMVPVVQAETMQLGQLEVDHVTADWGTPPANLSIDGNPLTIGGNTYLHGIGTHANSMILLDLDGGAERFTATVGVDDEVGEARGTVEFLVYADGEQIWSSGIMQGGDSPKPVDLNVIGIDQLRLVVTDAGDHIHYDHADWAEAALEVSGAKPRIADEPAEESYILTPTPPREPRINTEVWAKEMEDGSLAVGLFNRGWDAMTVVADWGDLALHGPQRVRDLWRQQDLGVVENRNEVTVPRHGCMLVRVWPED